MTTNQQTAAGIGIGLYSFVAGLTLPEWAAILGICGVIASVLFQWRRDRREAIAAKREQLAFEYRVGARLDRRADECMRCDEGRRSADETPA